MTEQKLDLATIYSDLEVTAKNDQLNIILNAPPKKEWVKKHPIYKNEYLPIDKIELLLTRIFQRWRVEVLETKQLLNSICVSIRLHYWNPSLQVWESQDGVGAHPVQTDKDAKPSDMMSIKDNGVMLALPIAKSRAIADAADHIGRIFGRDLNRKDTVESYFKETNDLSKTKY